MWSSMASHKRGGHKLDRTRSCADRALRGLRFISSNKVSYAWREVQANFDRLAHDGYLSRSDFAECIGMTESKEFALELFDTLNRRRQMKLDTISKEELREIWQKITDNSFDSRLLIFLDICSTGEAEEQDQGDPGRWPRGVKRSREVEEQIQHRRSWAARLSWALAEYQRGRRKQPRRENKQPRLEICWARLAARWKGICGEMGGEVLAGDLGRAAVSIPGEDDAVVVIQIRGSDVIS